MIRMKKIHVEGTHIKGTHIEKRYHKIFLVAAVVAVFAALCGIFIIRKLYSSLNDTVYKERISQLSEITAQMFDSTEEEISQYWNEAIEVSRRLNDARPRTSKKLTAFLKKENEYGHYGEDEAVPVVIDEDGRMYTPDGDAGIISDTAPLVNCTERVSFIKYNTMNVENDIVFAYKLESPVEISNTGREIRFVGVSAGMETIGAIFRSSAYNGNNSTYILSNDGSKLYVDEARHKNLVPGYNVFNVIRKAAGEEGLDFDEQLGRLAEGQVLSHVKIEGIDCFYAMYKMRDNDWFVMYINPAQEVAQGTVAVVNAALRTAIATAVFFLLATIIIVLCLARALHTRGLLRAEHVEGEKLRQMNKELEQAKYDAEQAYLVSQRANHAKTAFLNNMSHDIRTPMNAIIGFTSLAASHIDDRESVQNYLSKIMVSSEHLLSLINDVLDMSRIESGKVKIEEKECSLPAIMNDLQNILQSDVKAKSLNFHIDMVDVEHENIICDKLRLNQILLNITSNAIKFTRPGGTVALRVEEKPDAPEGYADYQFIVRDTGIGMSEDFIQKIFEPFTREENSTVSGIQGTGLGMAITKNIVDMMNGTIEVKSKPGEGTEFTVSVRFGVGAGDSELQAQEIAPEQFAGQKVLLVDDIDLNREIAVVILEEAGLVVETASNGQEAVDAVKNSAGDIRLVLMDVMMPVMDGYQATREIRKLSDPALAQIPIVAMTANAFEEDRMAAMDAGMNDHIAKPFQIDKLYRIMKDYLVK